MNDKHITFQQVQDVLLALDKYFDDTNEMCVPMGLDDPEGQTKYEVITILGKQMGYTCEP